jgi:PAS domain-containing protein
VSEQRPLELILARNLVASLSTAGFLVDEDERLVFYNLTAGELLGERFEEVGARPLTEWTRDHGLLQPDGSQLDPEELPFAVAIREVRPVHRRLSIRGEGGEPMQIEVSAVPLVGADGCHGAIVHFWPRDGAGP